MNSTADEREHFVRFEHPSGNGFTTINFGSFEVYPDGSASLTLVDGSGEIKLSRSTEWIVGPKEVIEGMKS